MHEEEPTTNNEQAAALVRPFPHQHSRFRALVKCATEVRISLIVVSLPHDQDDTPSHNYYSYYYHHTATTIRPRAHVINSRLPIAQPHAVRRGAHHKTSRKLSPSSASKPSASDNTCSRSLPDSIFGLLQKWRRPKQRRGPMVRLTSPAQPLPATN
jgi:hypothetical protein